MGTGRGNSDNEIIDHELALGSNPAAGGPCLLAAFTDSLLCHLVATKGMERLSAEVSC